MLGPRLALSRPRVRNRPFWSRDDVMTRLAGYLNMLGALLTPAPYRCSVSCFPSPLYCSFASALLGQRTSIAAAQHAPAGNRGEVSPVPAQGVVTLQQVADDHCFSPC